MHHHVPRKQRRNSRHVVNRVIERLELRCLLASDAANVFATFDGSIAQPNGTVQININLASGNFKLPNARVVVGFQLEAASASKLDPQAIQVQDSHGSPVPGIYTNSNLANNTESLTVSQLSLGSYTLIVGAQRGTSGAFHLAVFLAGDANGSRTVDQADLTIIKNIYGSKAGDGKYLVGADSNLDGLISSFDLAQALTDQGDSTNLNPLTTSIALTPAPKTLNNGTLVTNSTQVTVSGVTEPGATVQLGTGSDAGFGEGTTTADSSGHYAFAVTLDPGANPIETRSSDAFGQSKIASIQVTLDTTAPTIAVTSPTSGAVVNSNVSIIGVVTDDLSGVASLLAQVDGDSAVAVSFDSNGNFRFPTTLLLDGTDDGPHTVSLVATDFAGNVSGRSLISFTLDTIPPPQPAFTLAAADRENGSPLSTTDSRVTLVGQTDPNIAVALLGTEMTALSTNSGAFQFPNVALALGDNALTLIATDEAGNTSRYQATIHRDPPTGANQVILWDQVSLQAIENDASTPEYASRGLAIMSASVYDAVNSIDGTPGYYVKLAAPAGASADAAVATAAYTALSYLYPAQQTFLNSSLTKALASVPTGQSKSDGMAVGQSVANAIIAMRQNDGSTDFVDYERGTAPGDWQPTAPSYAPAENPQWATLKPFAMTSDSQFRPPAPPALTSQQYADDVNKTLDLGSVNSTSRTADETQIALFWNDKAGTYSPPGHWNSIADTVAQQEGDSLSQSARVFAELNIAEADAAIVAWDAKYTYTTWRPITLAGGAGTAINSDIETIANWVPLLTTPPFPEYVSGHSTFSAAAAAVLTSVFGDNFGFTATSVGLPGVMRSYASFDAAAAEAGESRIYGGIHFEFSNQAALTAGTDLGAYVLQTFAVSSDTTPPQITLDNTLPSGASKTNVTITGTVTDNLSGVAALDVSVDGGAYVPLSFDSLTGSFTFTTQLATDGTQDGAHAIAFQSTDAAGNVSVPVTFRFRLGTKAPKLALTSPVDGGALSAGATLIGTATTSGPALTMLNYVLDGGIDIPVAFNSDGTFSQALDLSRLTAGNHTLVVMAMDAAGNTTTQTLHLSQATAIPLAVANLTPAAGSSDIGVTFRPTVTFSRPIDAATLNNSNFFAADTTGNVVPATVVPSDDGTFAWLFFTNPLPSASTITITVDGSTIKAADGSLLDAADDGTPGSKLTRQFTTVSTSAVPGTTLSGIVADPGPDNKPGTTDDVKPGPDGILMTADDIYLNPIAGATVYILGEEQNAVISGADGRFSLSSVPSGDVKLVIDGRTATNPPSGVFFPEMVFDLTINPAVANTVMGSMGTTQEQAAEGSALGVYLPRLQSSILKPAGGSSPATITLDPSAAQGLTPQQASEYSITVAPNSLVGMNGQKMSGGQVGFSTVAPALIRDMLPQGVMQLATTLTIQAPGVATFSTPLQVTFANVYGAAPGSQLDVYSFNHTTGVLEITGTATVSADGKTATTDPGSGITHPGWYGTTPPGDCGGSGGPPPTPTAPSSNVTIEPPKLLDFITGEQGSINLEFAPPPPDPNQPPPTPPPPGCPTQNSPDDEPYTTYTIDVDGPLDQFMDSTGDVDLNGDSFSLYPGDDPRMMSASAMSYDALFANVGGFQNATEDTLYGAKIDVTEDDVDPDGSTNAFEETYYLYRYVDVVDPVAAEARDGDSAVFFRTLVGTERTKNLDLELPSSVATEFQGSNPEFTYDQGTWTFHPTTASSPSNPTTDQVQIVADDPMGPVQISSLNVSATATDPTTISIDQPGYETELTRVIDDLHYATVLKPNGQPGPYKVVYDYGGGTAIRDLPASALIGLSTTSNTAVTNITRPTVITPASMTGIGVGTVLLADTGGAQETITVTAATGTTFTADFTKLHAQGFTLVIQAERNGSYPVDTIVDSSEVVVASSEFIQEFAGFMPYDKTILGPSGVYGPDASFDAQQLAQLQTLVDSEGDALLAVVEDDYGFDPNAFHLATANAGSDVTMKWNDVFTNAGEPIYGQADFDAATDVLKPILQDNDLPLVSQEWALAEILNQSVNNSGEFAVAINMNFDNPNVTFAQFVANTVSHEIGHTFGLNDAYLNQTGGTVNEPPYDIMRSGDRDDPDLTFAEVNQGLLQASMGDQPDGDSPLDDELELYRNNINLPDSDVGIPRRDPGNGVPAPGLGVASSSGELLTGNSVQAPATAVGSTQLLNIVLSDLGDAPLQINSISLSGAPTSFSISTAGLAGTSVAPGATAILTIKFAPTVVGPSADTLTILTNDANQPSFALQLSGRGITATPSASLALGDNSLGGVTVGASSQSPHLATITNVGAQPLTISSIQVEAGGPSFTLLGVPDNLASNPITLATGQTFAFGVEYTASQPWLERAKIQIDSNDPNQPVETFGVTGTGLGSVVYPHWGNDYVAIEFPNLSSSIALRAVSDAGGNFSFFLPPQQFYHIAIFDPITGLIANGYGVTPRSGVGVNLTSGLVFTASTAKDTDGDGLPDDVEFAIGTSPANAFTAGDGIDDFTHVIIDQTNPTGLVPLTTGVVSTLALQGVAEAVTLQGSLQSSMGLTAYVATGPYGLAIVDASHFQKPVILGQIQLGGFSSDVSVDPNLQIAAVASSSKLNLVDVSNPSQPVLLQSLDIAADAVKVYEGVAYAAEGNEVLAVDLGTGNILATESFGGGHVDDLGIDQGNLYVLASAGFSSHSVYKVVLDGTDLLSPSESLMIVGHPTFARMHLFAANGYIYVGGSDNNDVQDIPGIEVLQDNGDSLAIVGYPSAIDGFDVTANGSGLALFTGANINLRNPQVGLLDVSDPNKTDDLLTVFSTPGVANSVAMADGLGFVADGSGGLAILNYLPFDTKAIPPTASISLPSSDVVGTHGSDVEVLEGSTVPVLANVADDVQVHNVELLVNGQVVENAVSAPYNLTVTLPTLAQNGSTPIHVQVEAIDTGGNIGLANALTIEVVRDTTPPQLASSNIPDGAVVGRQFRTVILQFSKPLKESTVTPADFQSIAPDSTVLTPEGIQFRDNDRTVQLTFQALELGTYEFVVGEASITDRPGNPLGSGNVTSSFTVLQYSAVWINPNGGDWSDPANWDLGVVPGVGDDVLIDIKDSSGDRPTITYDSGATEVNSVRSLNPLILQGGSLQVDATLEVDNTFTLAGGTLEDARVLKGTSSQAIIVQSYTSSTLDNVYLDEGLDLSQTSDATLNILDGLTLNGTAILGGSGNVLLFSDVETLGGAGTVVLDNNTMYSSASPILTVAPGITIQGPGEIYGDRLINQGTSEVDGTNKLLSLQLNSLQNEGSIAVGAGASLSVSGLSAGLGTVSLTGAGSSLSLNGANYTVDSSFNVTNGQTLNLEGTWSLGAGVSITVDHATLGLGSTTSLAGISLTDSTLEVLGSYTYAQVQPLLAGGNFLVIGPGGVLVNTGATVALNQTTGSLTLEGGELLGGTVTATGETEVVVIGNEVNFNGTFYTNTLDGVTLECDLDLPSHGGRLEVDDGLTLDGTATIGFETDHSYSTVYFSGSQTLDGTGDVVLSGTSQLAGAYGSTLTIGRNMTIHGSGGAIGSVAEDTLINEGTIDSDVTGGTLNVETTAFDNQGTMRAVNGGNLYVYSYSPADNTGTISAGVGSRIAFTGFSPPNVGGLVQEGAGTVAVEVGGLASGLHGSLSVSSGATFAGTLDVSLVNGYTPHVNDSIPIITFSTRTGQFGTVNVSNLPAGIAATLLYNSGNITLLFGNALKANDAVAAGPGVQPGLTPQELAPVVADAIDRWAAAGVSPTKIGQLQQLHFQITDLPDAELGMQDALTVWIDPDAAGHGWFLDSSHMSDREFFRPRAGDELQAPAGSPAFGKMDLLTVVEHEMGHVLGLTENGDPEGIMGETLVAGIRRLLIRHPDGKSNADRSALIDSAVAPSAKLVTGLGQTRTPARKDRPAVPSLAEAVDHLLETGDLSWKSPISTFDAPEPVLLGVTAASLRLTARVASTPAGLLPSGSLRFAIAGSRKSRLSPGPIARLLVTDEFLGE